MFDVRSNEIMDILNEVPFEKALECFKNGGSILVKLNGWERKYNGFTGLISDTISWQSIFYGTWYITVE
jgi:hypothetical protein